MISIAEAREWLRLDNTDNDEIIEELLAAIPSYIELSTGLKQIDQEAVPLVNTVSKFLLTLWYNAEQAEADKLQRTIDSLLKTLTLQAREYNEL